MNDDILNAYFAGLVDGEGNVDAYPYKGGRLRPVVAVSMTSLEAVTALQNHFGGNVHRRKVPERYKPQFRWEVTFAKAVRVCEILRPYLIVKAENADKVMRCPKNPRGRPRNDQVVRTQER